MACSQCQKNARALAGRRRLPAQQTSPAGKAPRTPGRIVRINGKPVTNQK